MSAASKTHYLKKKKLGVFQRASSLECLMSWCKQSQRPHMWVQAMVRSPSLLLYQLCYERGFIPFMASQKDEGEIENNPPSNPSLSPPLSPSHWMSVQGPLLGKVVCNYGARWGLFLPATLLIWSFPLSSTKSTPLNRALHHAGHPTACEVPDLLLSWDYSKQLPLK